MDVTCKTAPNYRFVIFKTLINYVEARAIMALSRSDPYMYVLIRSLFSKYCYS